VYPNLGLVIVFATQRLELISLAEEGGGLMKVIWPVSLAEAIEL